VGREKIVYALLLSVSEGLKLLLCQQLKRSDTPLKGLTL